MSIGWEIDRAIAAHSLWKAQLRGAIDSRTLDTPVGTLERDDQCAFGRWLHGPALSPEQRASAGYALVLRLHAQFHEVAARVARLALAGEKSEAEELIGAGFSGISTQLAAALIAWKKDVGA